MDSITKNKKSREIIDRMVEKGFPGTGIKQVEELKEGFFNVAYRVELSDNREVILKIAPAKDSLTMTYEKNIMYSEVDSMKKVGRENKVPVPKIFYYDNSHSLCDSDYFLMEKLSGESFQSLMEKLDEKAKSDINCKVGQYNKEINKIIGLKFGYYGQEDRQGSEWYPVFKSMILDTIKDAKALNIDQQVGADLILELLEKDKDFFYEVTTPKLVHWDIWAGNVFIDKNEITGFIDFERCLWGDELLEFGFRSFAYNEDFFRGYGIEELSESQKIRRIWYDIYFFLITILECDYRQYETRDAYNWGTKSLKELILELQNR